MRSAARRLVAFVLVALPPGAALAHGFHTTTTELTHRPATARLEVSLLVAAADLGRALGRKHAPFDEAEVVEHLGKTFRVQTPEGPRPLRFVGMESERRGLWLHFVFGDVPRLEGASLEHRVLHPTEPFAIPTVQIRAPGRPERVETLDRSRPRIELGRIDLKGG